MRRVSNIDINERMKEMIILIILILVGMFVSFAVNGQHQFQKERHRSDREKYRVQLYSSKKACLILNKKRTELPRSSFFASNRRAKPKAMAEMDAPGTKR